MCISRSWGVKIIQGFLHVPSIKAMMGSIDHLWTSHKHNSREVVHDLPKGPKKEAPKYDMGNLGYFKEETEGE